MSTDPIRFEFTFDEASYLRYERLAKGGRDMTSRDGSVVADVKLIDEPDFRHQGPIPIGRTKKGRIAKDRANRGEVESTTKPVAKLRAPSEGVVPMIHPSNGK